MITTFRRRVAGRRPNRWGWRWVERKINIVITTNAAEVSADIRALAAKVEKMRLMSLTSGRRDVVIDQGTPWERLRIKVAALPIDFDTRVVLAWRRTNARKPVGRLVGGELVIARSQSRTLRRHHDRKRQPMGWRTLSELHDLVDHELSRT